MLDQIVSILLGANKLSKVKKSWLGALTSLLSFVSIFVNALVIKYYFDWFVAQPFLVNPINYSQSVGIMACIFVLSAYLGHATRSRLELLLIDVDDSLDWLYRFVSSIIYCTALPGFLLLWGWLISQFV